MVAGGWARRALVVGVLVVAVGGLTGCSDDETTQDPASAGQVEETPSAEESSGAASSARMAPSADEADQALTELTDAEVEFLRANRASLRGMEGAADADLLGAGWGACAQLAGGTAFEDVAVLPTMMPEEIVEGWNNENLAGLATQTLCQEYDVVAD